MAPCIIVRIFHCYFIIILKCDVCFNARLLQEEDTDEACMEELSHENVGYTSALWGTVREDGSWRRR